ncbi:hypothetical protein EVAR_65967_1 [Eumeta japonica]|uniref:Uncharacterized protein n=1 Tax=Eumeta variegata TaxID=151549 RepID=A0A4C1Z8X7_EUMVA|nr:hypothetical protein EVAR_65967_1 [Eumeta japonica]
MFRSSSERVYAEKCGNADGGAALQPPPIYRLSLRVAFGALRFKLEPVYTSGRGLLPAAFYRYSFNRIALKSYISDAASDNTGAGPISVGRTNLRTDANQIRRARARRAEGRPHATARQREPARQTGRVHCRRRATRAPSTVSDVI